MTRTVTALTLLAITTALASGNAVGAADGSVGSTSTGNVSVSASLPTLVNVSSLNDIDFGSITDLSSDAEAGDVSICVYNNKNSDYHVKISSANNDGGNFRLFNGGSNYMPYDVYWYEGAFFTEKEHALVHNTAKKMVSAHNNSISCNSGSENNASLKLNLPASSLSGSPEGSYSDTLTIEVSP